ncbi:MAG: VOC family protein [Bacteroidota bacterium]
MVEVILYVADQARSRDFYTAVLRKAPVLDVPGMTEFELAENLKLGLMPEKGIARILCPFTPHPEKGNGIPRCELYLMDADPAASLKRAVDAGARPVSAAVPRDWGHTVAYCADPDGHIIAFAC